MRRVLFPLALVALVLAGCRNQADAGEELSYLRSTPEEYGSPLTAKNLMPLKQGMRWEYGVARAKQEPYREETVLVSSNGREGVFESRAKGKLISRETFRVDEKGIWVTGVLSGNGSIPLNPPLPLLPLPIEEGKVVAWQGTLGTGKQTITGRAWVRVTRRQEVTTPAGKFLAYRVDLRTDLAGTGPGSSLLASRWFAPGVGIVRTRTTDSRATIVKELLSPKKSNSSATPGVK